MLARVASQKHPPTRRLPPAEARDRCCRFTRDPTSGLLASPSATDRRRFRVRRTGTGFWDPAKAGALTAWAKGYWEAMRPYTLGGAYVNFMMDEGLDRVKATYRDNYDRLTEIKRKYDPDNFFRINQNIRPS